MKLQKLYPILLSLILLLSGCAGVEIPDTEVCSVSGTLDRGMFCSTTISSKERTMNFDESLDWLQANEEEEKGAALCQSSVDWTSMKIALETACHLLGKRCKKKVREEIESIGKTIKKLTGTP